MNVRNFSHRVLLIAAAVIFAFPMTLEAAKPVPVTVTAANPGEAIQGQELDVLVSGTGFGVGSTVTYLVTGTTDASQVAVLSVQYIAPTGQLKTRIKVNGTATVTDYDIAVVTSTGRRGKGTTLFKVNLDPAVILPITLGWPTGCGSTLAYSLNDGVYLDGLIVVGDTYGCKTGKDGAYRWQDGAWHDLGTMGAATIRGISEDVNNDGTVVGVVNSSPGGAFVASGGTMSPLPMQTGMTYSHAFGISQDGVHIVGTNSTEEETRAVRWSQDAGGVWSVEAIGNYGPGVRHRAVASSDDGSVIIGMEPYPDSTAVEMGWVWMEGGGSTEWISFGDGTEVFDIDPTATMIVGDHQERCGTKCWNPYKTAAYWTLEAGDWVLTELTPLDSAWSSYAYGVGMVNGKLVIVGRSDVSRGTGRDTHAVAWLPQPGGGYGAPIQLAAIDARTTLAAVARDVNANGVVAGWADMPKGNRQAVLWILPPIP